MSGRETMRCDAQLLAGVEQRSIPPTLRFFRFKKPTVSFGRLQKLSDVAPLIPKSWDCVQRPTGGGIVFHDNDLCLSLCWMDKRGPLPMRPQEQYRWIHSVILEALAQDASLRMASCADLPQPDEPFLTRACFKNPVGYDLLCEKEKIVGGALRCTRRATLYQGSVQLPFSEHRETRLSMAFERALQLQHV